MPYSAFCLIQCFYKRQERFSQDAALLFPIFFRNCVSNSVLLKKYLFSNLHSDCVKYQGNVESKSAKTLALRDICDNWRWRWCFDLLSNLLLHANRVVLTPVKMATFSTEHNDKDLCTPLVREKTLTCAFFSVAGVAFFSSARPFLHCQNVFQVGWARKLRSVIAIGFP